MKRVKWYLQISVLVLGMVSVSAVAFGYLAMDDVERLESPREPFLSFQSPVPPPANPQAMGQDMLSGNMVYVLDIVAQTGVAIDKKVPVAFGPAPSINDSGKVAFVARGPSSPLRGAIFVKDEYGVYRDFYIGSPATLHDQVQINNNDQVVYRQGFEYQGVEDGLINFVTRLDTADGGVILGSGSWTPMYEAPFNEVRPWATLNNNGRGVFGAIIGSSQVLATRDSGSGSHYTSGTVSISANLYPMITDNNLTVVRAGGTNTSPIILFSDETLSSAWFIAGSPEFRAVGERPGISDNGVLIGFFGDNVSQGGGIFGDAAYGPFKIAGRSGDAVLDPGETFSDSNGNGRVDAGEDKGILSNFGLQPRVAVNLARPGSTGVYTVAYVAWDLAGKMGLYTSFVDLSNQSSPQISGPSLVVKAGDEISGLNGTVSNIQINDAVNNRGQLVFWVSMSDGSQAIVRATPDVCANKVVWQSGQPIKDAGIEPYYFYGSKEDPQIKPLPLTGPSTKSADDGSFCLPPEVTDFSNPPSDEIQPRKRGIRAKVAYTEITGDGEPFHKQQTVINYPEWDPLRPLRRPTAGHTTIKFPSPVFFQPGTFGQINNNSADGPLRVFLTLDSGASSEKIAALALSEKLDAKELLKWIKIKRGDKDKTPIPAFLYFAMPSKDSCFGSASDNVPWGYDNCFSQSDERIESSRLSVATHFENRIKPEIEKLSPKEYTEVPFHVLGHSLGGVITRNWLVGKKDQYPPAAKYVTFDSPHGGVSYANSILGILSNFWNETHLNGKQAREREKPSTNDDWGWNHFRRMQLDLEGTQNSRLFFSTLDNLQLSSKVVTPDASAFGVGRIMKPTGINIFWKLFGARPNGYCERFLHGWNMGVADEGHSIQSVPRVFISAARFLAGEERPRMGSQEIPDTAFFEATLETGSGSQCPDVTPVDDVLRSRRKFVMKASDYGKREAPLNFNANDRLFVRALVSRTDADFTVLDNGDVPLARTGQKKESFGEGYFVSFEAKGPSAGGKVRMTAGAEKTAVYAEVSAIDSTYQTTVGAMNDHNPLGAAVTLRLQTLDGMGNVVKGTSGTGEITIIKPDGAEEILSVFDDGAHNDEAAGDGLYGNVFPNTGGAGYYFLSGDLTVELGGGIKISRTGNGMFVVDSNIRLTNVTKTERLADDDKNGLADAVEVAVSFDVSGKGELRILADVMSAGISVENIVENFTVSSAPSRQTVALRIPSEVFRKIGTGSPLTLGSISVVESAKSLLLASIPDHQTQAYALGVFELSPTSALLGSMPSYGSRVGGYKVILNGSNLENVTKVYFGTKECPGIVLVDSSALSVTVPSWDGVHDKVAIKVVTPWNETVKAGLFEYYDGNRPPQLAAISDKTVVAGSLLNFSISATDPDGNALNLFARTGNGAPVSSMGAVFTDNGKGTASFSWTPAAGDAGNIFPIVFKVVDQDGLSDEKVIFITVLKPLAPVIESVSPSSAAVGESITITGTHFGEYLGSLKYNPVADINKDTRIDMSDFSLVSASWGSFAEPVYNPAADVNKDGIIDSKDLNVLTAAWASNRGSSFVEFYPGVWAKVLSWSDTRIVCEVPPDAASGKIYVTTDIGKSNGVSFAKTPPPGFSAAQMQSPLPGTMLPSSTVDFKWKSSASAAAYRLSVGTTPGASDIYGQSLGSSASVRVSGIPQSGKLAYVLLSTGFPGKVISETYVYQTGKPARIATPAANSTLTTSSVLFTWDPGIGVSESGLYVGTSLGAANIYKMSSGLYADAIVPGIPLNGQKVYVRLWSKVVGVWKYIDYVYSTQVMTVTWAQMTWPQYNTVISSPNVTFQWSAGTDVAEYSLAVGTTLGGINIYNKSAGLTRSASVTNIPLNAGRIYARLTTKKSTGQVVSVDYLYKTSQTTPNPSPSPSPSPTASPYPF